MREESGGCRSAGMSEQREDTVLIKECFPHICWDLPLTFGVTVRLSRGQRRGGERGNKKSFGIHGERRETKVQTSSVSLTLKSTNNLAEVTTSLSPVKFKDKRKGD